MIHYRKFFAYALRIDAHINPKEYDKHFLIFEKNGCIIWLSIIFDKVRLKTV